MSDNPRIEELRRRVQADPASIAFAALAEEYRRVGNYQEAIETCVAGLKRHPSYLSAHVTLGRALIEVGRFDEAEQELQLVLKAAPENLAAIRGMAEIHHRRPEHGFDEAAHAALSQLAAQHAQEEQEQAAAAAAASEPAAVPFAVSEPAAAFEPPPPAYEAPTYEPPTYEPLSFEPPATEAPAYDIPTQEAPSYAPGTFTPAAYDPPAYEPPAYEPPAYEAPALAAASYEPPAQPTPSYEMPTYESPQYDPPGTFEFTQSAAPAFHAPVAVEERNPQLEALERFLEAIVTSRTPLRAH